MEIKRRRLLQLFAASPLLSLLPTLGQADELPASVWVASAADSADKRHWLVISDEMGSEQLRHELPARAHHVEAHPTQPWIAVVARRPGYYIDIVDYRSKQLLTRIEPEQGRHFYGHAIFSQDGKTLYSTEMDVASGEGRIVVRHAADNFAKKADWSSFGTGPHELLLTPDQQTLVIANGGILTDGRDKLNIDTMQPSLTYVDAHNGTLLEQQQLPAEDHQLSIRHIDINAAGEVIIALQYQGDKSDDKALVALHRRGESLQLLRAPAAINQQMVQYCGSARFDRSGKIAAVSAPRGGLITFWEMPSGKFLTSLSAQDGCGVAASAEDEAFIVTTGRGHWYAMYPRETYREPMPLPPTLSNLAWDNHLALFTPKV